MSTSLNDIASWSAVTMLNRPDVLDIARDLAKDAYLNMCGKVPFDDLQQTTAELPMTLGTATYDLSTIDPAILGICSIRITYSSTSRRRLKRSHVRVYDSFGTVNNGRPYSYGRWGNAMEVNPPPDSSAYTYRIRYWSRPTIATTSQDTMLVTPVEWDELVKWETLYRLLHAVRQEDRAMVLMGTPIQPSMPGQPRKTRVVDFGIIPRLWNDLLKTYSQREQVDEDFSLNPIYRAYTAVSAGR